MVGYSERKRVCRVSNIAILAISILGFLISGCGLATDHVVVSYHPQEDFRTIEGAGAVTIRVEVSDLRSNKTELSKKGDEYEFLAPIVAENDVAETLAGAIRTELTNRGFRLGEEGVLVLAELSKFYNRFRAGKAQSEVFMHVQVKKPNGDLVYSKIVKGEGVESATLRSGENAKIALEAALKDGLYKLMTDIRFIDSLFEATKT